MIDSIYKKIAIIGLARSGKSAARLALSDGFEVLISDAHDTPKLRGRAEKFDGTNAVIELGGHSDKIYKSDMIIVSPGVPLNIPILDEAKKRGIPVISEIEFAFRHEQGKVIAVTGSNGKSTTATLIARIFADAGIYTLLAGNIGNPYSENVVKSTPESVTVLELSSFQLEALDTFHPFIAVLLNLSPDHLDRYETVEEYYEAKFHIFDRQKENDYAVLFADQPEVVSVSDEIFSKPLWFSSVQKKIQGAYAQQGIIYRNEEKIMQVPEIGIPGPHNLSNALSAVATTIPFDISPESLRTTLKNFAGIEHRLERFLEHNGILFVNDSKSTNPDSLKFAMLSFDRPIVLIAGGYDKGNNFSPLRNIFKQKVKTAVFTGDTGESMANQFAKNIITCAVISDFEKAVRRAVSLAIPGDVVLLSPGCASYDAFNNFEERGRFFKNLVRKIIEGK
ncbi:UDP-N-acetylmuramoyl-L-alanine--D-glutamate ligase [bacterium]|nr:UDP-N-acetylmuramoyl-L-alanine--D-glutamate ligase [bacterium]